MKTLKAIVNFFKSKKFHLWAVIMAGVIVVSFGVMSWIMIADRIVYGHVKHEDGTTFDFVPDRFFIDTITISNDNENLYDGFAEFNNDKIGGIQDDVVLPSEAAAITDVLNRLDNGRKTNTLKQFFTRGKSGEQSVSVSNMGRFVFEDLSEGIWLRIVFATPQFVVNHDNNNNWRIEKFNPNYPEGHRRDDRDRPIGHRLQSTYNTHTINAIHIPLGRVENRFTQQTWYLSTGSYRISNTTHIGYSFTTYGNYYPLLRFASRVDDDFLLHGIGTKKK
jgi:hypothetical protein